MSENCPFCRIIRRQLPAFVITEDDHVIVFLSKENHPLVTPSQMIIDTYLSFGWQRKDVGDRASGSHKLLSDVRCLRHLHTRFLPSKHKVYVNHHMARFAAGCVQAAYSEHLCLGRYHWRPYDAGSYTDRTRCQSGIAV